MEFHEKLQELRKQKGLTQEELGKVIGVQKSAIRKYESGMVQNIKRSSIIFSVSWIIILPHGVLCTTSLVTTTTIR